MNGWLNIYKPRGISSARIVSKVKKVFAKSKIGHTGTLDLEAEGVLPIAVGQATKLASFLTDARKQYEFVVKFGARTDTLDSSGSVLETTNILPDSESCYAITRKFVGEITQIPPSYSAIKVNGKRSYDLARAGNLVKLPERKVTIYSLKCIDFDEDSATAKYVCECSKGTYIRTLAEDISLSLQSLGFVLELRRLRVGMFDAKDAMNVSDYVFTSAKNGDSEINNEYCVGSFAEMQNQFQKLCLEKLLKVEDVLDDIPVFDIDDFQAQKIRFGQKCFFDSDKDYENIWLRNEGNIVAIGALHQKMFKSSRVFI